MYDCEIKLISLDNAICNLQSELIGDKSDGSTLNCVNLYCYYLLVVKNKTIKSEIIKYRTLFTTYVLSLVS